MYFGLKRFHSSSVPKRTELCSGRMLIVLFDQVLQTKFMNDRGVVSVTGQTKVGPSRSHTKFIFLDFLPRPRRDVPGQPSTTKPLLPWLIRRIECIRGSLPILVQCAPAFNYARSAHKTTIVDDESIPEGPQKKALFTSDALSLDLRYVAECSASEGIHAPEVTLELLDLSAKGHKGLAVQSLIKLTEGQCVTFVLRTPPAVVPVILGQDEKSQGKLSRENGSKNHKRKVEDPVLTKELLSSLLHVSYIYRLFFVPSQHSGLYRLRFGTGMNGSINRHTPDLGRRLSYAVRSRSNC